MRRRPIVPPSEDSVDRAQRAILFDDELCPSLSRDEEAVALRRSLECAHDRRADGDRAAAPSAARVQELCRSAGDLEALRVRLLAALERRDAGVQRYGRYQH